MKTLKDILSTLFLLYFLSITVIVRNINLDSILLDGSQSQNSETGCLFIVPNEVSLVFTAQNDLFAWYRSFRIVNHFQQDQSRFQASLSIENYALAHIRSDYHPMLILKYSINQYTSES